MNTLELLEGTGVQCPPLPTYLDAVVTSVRESFRRRREETGLDVEDPFDQLEGRSPR